MKLTDVFGKPLKRSLGNIFDSAAAKQAIKHEFTRVSPPPNQKGNLIAFDIYRDFTPLG